MPSTSACSRATAFRCESCPGEHDETTRNVIHPHAFAVAARAPDPHFGADQGTARCDPGRGRGRIGAGGAVQRRSQLGRHLGGACRGSQSERQQPRGQPDLATDRPHQRRRRPDADQAEQSLEPAAAGNRCFTRRAAGRQPGDRHGLRPGGHFQRRRHHHDSRWRRTVERLGGAGGTRAGGRSGGRLSARRHLGRRNGTHGAQWRPANELPLDRRQLRRGAELPGCLDPRHLAVPRRDRRRPDAEDQRHRGFRRFDHRRLAIDRQHQPTLAGRAGAALADRRSLAPAKRRRCRHQRQPRRRRWGLDQPERPVAFRSRRDCAGPGPAS